MVDIYPNWRENHSVKALTTTRLGGVSMLPYATNNLAFHVNDNPQHVAHNRLQLKRRLKLPNEPEWLEQTHSNKVSVVEEDDNRQVDAVISRDPSRVLAIMTADCLPILCCDKNGKEIAAIHAGWRGLASGIIENTLAKMKTRAEDVSIWLGPAICQACFEVGEELRETFVQRYPFSTTCFIRQSNKFLANLAQIALKIFHHYQIFTVYESNLCTFEKKSEFYSYRREQQTGRMATLIWFNQNQG